MDRILCIDIGGTRIKSAILKNHMSLMELSETEVKIIDSESWLNSSLPKLLSVNDKNSLIHTNKYYNKYDRISVGVPLTVEQCGEKVSGYYVRNNEVPTDLKRKFEKEANCQVDVASDIEAWIRGVLNYYNICNLKVKYPCLFIICGTAVGIGYVDSNMQIKSYYINDKNHDFKHITKASNKTVKEGWEVHGIIGKGFFMWVRNKKKHWNFARIQNEFTIRLAGLLKDMELINLCKFKDINTIFLGGGSVDYISSSIHQTTQKQILVLKDNNLKIPQTLLPILGLINYE